MTGWMAAVPPVLAEFVERLVEIAGADCAAAIVQSMLQAKRVGYWVNPLRAGTALPDSVPMADVPGFWWVPAAEREHVMSHPCVAEGAVYPMNPSSALAVRALVPGAGDEVLDLAAAPGGKTLLMAAAMDNGGRIAAVDAVARRFHRMRANLSRCGVANTQFYRSDGRRVGSKVPGRFDAALLDAPCSSEARIRLDEPASFGHWKLRKIRECARKQKALLHSAFAALKPGGRLVYCTCSYAPEENEMAVNDLLQKQSDARMVAVDAPGAVTIPGLTRWRGHDLDLRLSQAVRVLPDDLWDGFFLCRIDKVSSA